MPQPVKFRVEGRPVPKERPRHTKNGHSYTPPKTVAYEKLVAEAWRSTGATTFEGPIAVLIDLHPTHADVTVTEAPTTASRLRGDVDNYIKSILDGLQGDVGMAFVNDRDVHMVAASKN